VKLLTRIKTFVATGLATAGRLYAGDLNQIQDGVAAYSDYAQRVDLATLGIGESGLALLHYGTLEARLTGAMRTDGILRGLGGLYAGQYTTAQRNAIPTGSRPYGLVIWNSDTNRMEKNIGTDTTPNWQSLGGVNVSQSGTLKGVEQGINIIAGTGVTVTVTDNPGTGNVDITVNASAQAVSGVIPIGGCCEYAGASDPANFLICDGRSLVRTSPYDQLFGVIGTAFNAVDGTHFNIPDCRNRVVVGVGSNNTLAETDGLPVGSRDVYHYHQLQYDLSNTSDGVVGGNHVAPGHSPSGSYITLYTNDSGPVGAPAHIGLNYVIRYQ